MSTQTTNYSLISIKIVANGVTYDWIVSFMILNFNSLLEQIKKCTLDKSITNFQYFDEDGDKIVVKSDEEMKSLLKFYLTYYKNCLENRLQAEPLVIYVASAENSIKTKNIKSLKLNTSDNVQQVSGQIDALSIENLNTIVSSQEINPNELTNLGVIGEGHGGFVYKCLHGKMNKLMALKVRPLGLSYETKKHIVTELEILYKSSSPYVIAYYGSFFHDCRIAICTEYMDCGTLESYKKIPEKVLARVAVSIVKGLNYLFTINIMHRDLKPSNVLLNSNGHVKLSDFGDGIQMICSLAVSYVGTNAYMSPERVRGETFGFESDVWSLGLTLLETALGCYPYGNGNSSIKLQPIQLVQLILNEEPSKIPSDKYSQQFSDFICACLTKNPLNRPKPKNLLEMSLIMSYDDGNFHIISNFLKNKIENN